MNVRMVSAWDSAAGAGVNAGGGAAVGQPPAFPVRGPYCLRGPATMILCMGTMTRRATRGQPGQGIYYGWVLVVTLAVTETTSWGVLYYAFTVFLAPMQTEMGWSRGEMTGAFSLALAISAVAALPTGRWLDRHGPRVLMTAGSCAATVLVLAWSAAPNLFVFYLVWAGIGVTLAAVLYEPAFVVVATWFTRKRGRALTILTFIAGFASVIYIPLAGWLVQAQGWRGALVTLAILLAVGTIPLHALVLRRRPADLGLAPDGASLDTAPVDSGQPPSAPRAAAAAGERSIATRVAVRGVTFRLLTIAFFLNALGQIALTVHLVPYLTDRGNGAAYAAGIAGLIGIMAMPGRLIFTPLGDRVPRGILTAFIFLLQAIAIVVLLLTGSTPGILVFVVLFGAGFGAITPARAALVADFYGPANYGAISGVMMLFVTGARAISPVGVGAIYDIIGGYEPVFWVLVGFSVLSAAAVLLAERSAATAPNKRRRE